MISDPIILEPRESIVFVEQMSPDQFRSWWGRDRLPPQVQVHTFHGFSLGDYGEVLYLWNAGATDPYDSVATVGWASATTGVSLQCVNYCNQFTTYGCIGECLSDSTPEEDGAFTAVDCGDLGSPGLTAPVRPGILGLEWNEGQVILRCRVNAGRQYRLCSTSDLARESWNDAGSHWAEDCILWIEVAADAGCRFFRLEELP